MENKETIVFGGGCFWCTEAVFKMLKGVISVLPGYSGGEKDNPSYYEVAGGGIGYAEVVEIVYDSSIVYFRDLLTVFFASHDGTSLNKQGNDVGTEYRSVVFYTTKKQKIETEKFIEEINNSNPEGNKIVTEVSPLVKFYKAEDDHLDFYEKNKNNSYCQIIINPKLEKVQEHFAKLLKENK